MEATFSYELSFAELRWLAGAFGLARLPLSLPDVSAESLLKGQKMLLERGLIEPGQAGGWQIHPFLALALQWTGGASRYWVFDLYRPKAQPVEFALFLQGGASLLVLPLAEGMKLIACQDVEAAIKEWQLAVSLPYSIESRSLPEWNVPQPVTVIRSSWNNPQLALTMAGPEFLTWAKGLDWAGEWALVVAETRLPRLALAACGNSVWSGRFSQGRPGEFPLKRFILAELREVLAAGE